MNRSLLRILIALSLCLLLAAGLIACVKDEPDPVETTAVTTAAGEPAGDDPTGTTAGEDDTTLPGEATTPAAGEQGTTAAEPEATTPAEPEATTPAEPETTTKPEVTQPAEPETTGKPEVTQPAEPETTGKPEVTQPAEPETTKKPEVTQPAEPETTKPVEPQKEPEMWNSTANKKLVPYQVLDALHINDSTSKGVFPGGHSDVWNSEANVGSDVTKLSYFGWIAINGSVGTFGYQIDNAAPVYSASFVCATEKPVYDTAAANGASNASRMSVAVDVSGVTGSGHTVRILYKTAEGKVILLNKFALSRTANAVTYYVCNRSGDPAGTAKKSFTTLLEAIPYCEKYRQEGYRVVSGDGKTAYLPYTELQCDILRECKYVTDYVRTNGFTYGHAPINPAIDHAAKLVSCDRFVAWALYNVGYTEQPYTHGVVVSDMAAWCEKNGFIRIDREADLQPGDVVLVNFNGSIPLHTFIHAGSVGASGSPYYRYDCGSDHRIQSVQPSSEPIHQFWRAYRPVPLTTPDTSTAQPWNTTENKQHITHLSFDELVPNGGTSVFPAGKVDSWNKIADLDANTVTLRYWGWVGIKGSVGTFGYQIDDRDPVFSAAFTHAADQGVVNVAISTGATTASRMAIQINVGDLRGAGHTVRALYKTPEGKVIILSSFTVNKPDTAPDPVKDPEMWDAGSKDKVTHQSFDELRINNNTGVFPAGKADSWNKVANVSAGANSLRYWGWIGIKGSVGTFGYQIDNNEAVFNAAFAQPAEGDVVTAATSTGATAASRMAIDIDISGLSGSGHTVRVLYKTADGQVLMLNKFTLNK